MKLFKNPTILKILDYYKNLWSLSYVSGVTHWDLETYMPKLGAGARGEALGRLSVIRQKMFLDREFVNLIHKSESIKSLNDQERAVVRILLHDLKFYDKLPPKFLKEFEILTNTATVIWREAKEKNNYKMFEKPLAKIFEMNMQMADHLGYKYSPYDALLDLFEEGLKVSTVESFFKTIKGPLKKLLTKIVKSKKYIKVHRLEKTKYDTAKMKVLNEKVLNYFWSDMDRFRLDISSHPFTTSFGKDDTRITTWYHDTDFSRSLMATIHEFGHALYSLQSSDGLEMTPVAGGSSLVIHESQSRFWENFIGRSPEFINTFLNDFREVVKDPKLTADEVYLYFNKVSPGFFRVEADEVTYHFHIMIRYEIEKEIIEGKLKINDIRETWNTKMEDYLGIVPKKDSEGVLQDIHWSGGAVGYFPTYSLGTFLGAQWEDKVNKDLKGGEYEKIKLWLERHIHQYGSTYTLKDLLKKNKLNYDPMVNLNYLKKKYKNIYEF